MRQRNDTGHVLPDVMAWPTDEHPDLRPFGVGPGEEIDHPTLLGGFTSLEPDPEPEPGTRDGADGQPDPGGDQRPDDAEADTAGETAKTRRARRAAAMTQPQGGEQQ